VDAVLRHGPTPGRKAIDRFTTEIVGNAWPNKAADLREYLRERYFARGKDVLRRNLAQVIVKGCLAPFDDDFTVWKRLRKSAWALDEIEPALLADTLRSIVRRAEEGSGLDDTRIIRFIGALGELQPAWDAVPQTSVPRFATLVRTANFEVLAKWVALSATTPIPEVEEAIKKRLRVATVNELAHVINVRPARKHLPLAMERFEDSSAWRAAEYRMVNLVLPLAKYNGDAELHHLRRILAENSQVREASSMPPLLEQLYDSTRTAPGMEVEWVGIVEDLEATAPDDDPDGWYAYPQLRAKVRAPHDD